MCYRQVLLAALQYLGGYVINNLYKWPKNSNNYQSEECQQGLSLLPTCQSDLEINGNIKLVSSFNRSGLCIINETVERNTLKFGLVVIDTKVIFEKIKLFSYIRDFLNDIKHSSEIPVSEEVLNVTLHDMLHLYIKVCAILYPLC